MSLSETIDLKQDRINHIYTTVLQEINRGHSDSVQESRFKNLVRALHPQLVKGNDSDSDGE